MQHIICCIYYRLGIEIQQFSSCAIASEGLDPDSQKRTICYFIGHLPAVDFLFVFLPEAAKWQFSVPVSILFPPLANCSDSPATANQLAPKSH